MSITCWRDSAQRRRALASPGGTGRLRALFGGSFPGGQGPSRDLRSATPRPSSAKPSSIFAGRDTARDPLLHVIQNLNYGGMERVLSASCCIVTRRFESHVLCLQYLGRFASGLDAAACSARRGKACTSLDALAGRARQTNPCDRAACGSLPQRSLVQGGRMRHVSHG